MARTDFRIYFFVVLPGARQKKSGVRHVHANNANHVKQVFLDKFPAFATAQIRKIVAIGGEK